MISRWATSRASRSSPFARCTSAVASSIWASGVFCLFARMCFIVLVRLSFILLIVCMDLHGRAGFQTSCLTNKTLHDMFDPLAC